MWLIDPPKKFTLRLPVFLYERIKAQAATEKVSVQRFIERELAKAEDVPK